MSCIYRGFDIIWNGKSFLWRDDHGVIHGPFTVEEEAMKDIDAYKKRKQT